MLAMKTPLSTPLHATDCADVIELNFEVVTVADHGVSTEFAMSDGGAGHPQSVCFASSSCCAIPD